MNGGFQQIQFDLSGAHNGNGLFIELGRLLTGNNVIPLSMLQQNGGHIRRNIGDGACRFQKLRVQIRNRPAQKQSLWRSGVLGIPGIVREIDDAKLMYVNITV